MWRSVALCVGVAGVLLGTASSVTADESPSSGALAADVGHRHDLMLGVTGGIADVGYTCGDPRDQMACYPGFLAGLLTYTWNPTPQFGLGARVGWGLYAADHQSALVGGFALFRPLLSSEWRDYADGDQVRPNWDTMVVGLSTELLLLLSPRSVLTLDLGYERAIGHFVVRVPIRVGLGFDEVGEVGLVLGFEATLGVTFGP